MSTVLPAPGPQQSGRVLALYHDGEGRGAAILQANQAGLAQLTQWVEAGDGEALEQMFEQARQARTRWHQRFGKS